MRSFKEVEKISGDAVNVFGGSRENFAKSKSSKIIRDVSPDALKKLDQMLLKKDSGIDDLATRRLKIAEQEDLLVRRAEELRQQESGIIRHREEAGKEGYESGYNEGYQEGKKRADEEAKALRGVAVEMANDLRAIRQSLNDKMMRLVLSTARQVVMSEITHNTDCIFAVLKDAVESITEEIGILTVSAHPETIQIIQAFIPEAKMSNESNKTIDVIYKEDHRLAKGGFILTHNSGKLDYSMETRWKNVFSTLTEDQESLKYEK